MNQRSRSFSFTVNNYTDVEYNTIKTYCQQATYFVIGKEVGENGTPHLQGYVHFANARTFRSITGNLPRAHVEVSRGSGQQNRDYCTKDGDFVEEGEVPRPRGQRMSAEEKIAANKRLLDVSLSYSDLVDSGELSAYSIPTINRARSIMLMQLSPFTPDALRGLWIWGPPGTGKTRYVWDTYGDSLYEKGQNKWFDGYAGEETIIMDDMDSDCLGHHLKRWMDRYPVKGEIKGGTVHLRHLRFVVTSNFRIEELFLRPQFAQAIRRRCQVIHMDNFAAQ